VCVCVENNNNNDDYGDDNTLGVYREAGSKKCTYGVIRYSDFYVYVVVVIIVYNIREQCLYESSRPNWSRDGYRSGPQLLCLAALNFSIFEI